MGCLVNQVRQKPAFLFPQLCLFLQSSPVSRNLEKNGLLDSCCFKCLLCRYVETTHTCSGFCLTTAKSPESSCCVDLCLDFPHVSSYPLPSGASQASHCYIILAFIWRHQPSPPLLPPLLYILYVSKGSLWVTRS